MPHKITNTAEQDPIINLFQTMSNDGSGILAQEKRGQQELCKSSQLPLNTGGYGKDKSAIPMYKKLGFVVAEPNKSDPLFVDVQMPKGWHVQSTDHSMWTKLVDDKGHTRASIFYKAAFYDRDAFINFEKRYSFSIIKWLPDEKKYKTEKETYTEIVKDSNSNYREQARFYGDNVMFESDKIIEIMESDGTIHRLNKNKPKTITKTRNVKVSIFNDLYEETNNTPHYFEIKDGDKVIYTSRTWKFKEKYPTDGKTNDKAHRAWWDKHDAFIANRTRKAISWLNKNYPGWNNINAYWN